MELQDGCLNHPRDPSSNCYVCWMGCGERLHAELDRTKAELAKLREAGEALAKLVKVMNPGEVNGYWDGEKWHDLESAIPAWRAAVGGGEESDA